MKKKIYEAVTAVFICGDQIFMIKRQNHLLAFPGYHAFAGGKVDRDENDHPLGHQLFDQFPPKLMNALDREIREELSYDLVKGVKNKEVSNLQLFGTALTPDFNPYRFNTYFYRIDVTHCLDFHVDQGEVQSSGWESAESLLNQFYQGRLLAVPPIIALLKRLAEDQNALEIPDLEFVYDEEHQVPWIESIHNIRQLIPRSHTLPPADRTNCFVIGDKGHPRFVVDPSPRDDEEYQRLVNTLSQIGPDHIFITHHHHDHCQYVDRLAKELQAPVFMSQDCEQRLNKKRPDLLKDISIQHCQEGDVLTQWNGQDVVVYEVPGHDEGQLALAAQDLSWFIVGDLIQGVGTVVIGGQEGDMQKYMASLEKVIDLNPKIIIPSHGIAMGGVFRLEETLRHRLQRENEVLERTQKGMSEDEILDDIYQGLAQGLRPYARENIRKHLEKLKKENRC